DRVLRQRDQPPRRHGLVAGQRRHDRAVDRATALTAERRGQDVAHLVVGEAVVLVAPLGQLDQQPRARPRTSRPWGGCWAPATSGAVTIVRAPRKRVLPMPASPSTARTRSSPARARSSSWTA